MGDSENKIEYTPDELAEIERIAGFIGEEVEAPPLTTAAAVSVPARSRINDEEAPEPEEDIEVPLDDEPFPEERDLTDEGAEEEGIEDISDLIQEVDEAEAASLTEKPFTDAIEETIEPVAADFDEAPVTGTPMQQLEGLTRAEPESVDDQELSPDEFVGGDAAETEDSAEPAAEFREIEEPAEIDFPDTEEPVSIARELDEEIPDLSDLSLQEPGEIPEAGDEDMPDIDIGDLAGPETDVGSGGGDDDSFIDDLGEPSLDLEPEPPRSQKASALDREEIPEADLLEKLTSDDLGDMIAQEAKTGPIRREPVVSDEEPIEIEMLDEDHDAPPPPKRKTAEKSGKKDAIELSSGEMRRLKKAILLFNPALRQSVKETVINDLLPPQDMKQLISMILSGRSEDAVLRFLEKKLGQTITLVDEAEIPGRRVITQRPEYTRVGRERQKRLLRATKIGGIAAICAFAVMLLSYQFIYRPWMAKRMIARGVSLIVKSKNFEDKQKNFPAAEDIFKEVDEDYRKNYIEGYNAYGNAYFKVKEYARSINKLNKAYLLDKHNIETLNNLGNYYSKVPGETYRFMKQNLNQWYFGGRKAVAAEMSQLDLAIDLYTRVLTREPTNEKAMYGIGNAYFHQGQYRKAQDYFRNIIKANPDSPVGYSGLLNLYIEYDKYNPDSFKRVVETHMNLLDRDLLPEVPRALLAKLAAYYLTKQSTPSENVRIDFGVISPRFKDEADNIYPAVLNVLKVLNAKDPDYPPLLLQYARLNMTQKNYRVMKRYLDKAVSLSPSYFGALHLTGEYFYYTKEPVQAYRYLKRAVDSYSSQPEFTTEEFYYETENLGKTYALMGNIFYYYSDKIVYRFGDLDDEIVEDDLEKMANYRIAGEKYETALAENFESPELHYNLGRIYYLGRQYRKALDQWLNLYQDFVERPELMIALGNAFYHLGNYETGKAEYMKLISVFEYEADRIRLPNPGMASHVKVFRTLSSAYNNLGAVYQQRNNEAKSAICYWKSIDYAKRLDTENEFARVNLARGFRERETQAEPILDEDIPYSVDIYREDLR